MANELNIALAKSGLTVTAQRYQAGAAVGSAISCPETGSTGFYSGNMTGTAGTYQVAFISASANVGSGSIVWDGTAEVASSAPTVVQIRTEMDANSTKLANLDTTVSSRLASSAYSAAPTTAQIATAVEGSLLNEVDGQAVLNAIVGAIGNTNLSEVSIVAAVRADLERVGGKIDSIPAAPTAAQIRSEMDSNSTKLANLDATVSSRLAPSGTLATVTTLTNAPTVPTAASIRAEIDSNSTQLAAIKAKTDLLPASPAATGDIPSANITAIKAKTDLLETTRLAQCSTVSTTGAQLAAALS
jgi:hypothetical protein